MAYVSYDFKTDSNSTLYEEKIFQCKKCKTFYKF